jgi:DNA-directed RNA polymerase alpha subunit
MNPHDDIDAARVDRLVRHLHELASVATALADELKQSGLCAGMADPLSAPVPWGRLSTRCYNSITGYFGNESTRTFRDLIRHGRTKLLTAKNLGERSMADIDHEFSKLGVTDEWMRS